MNKIFFETSNSISTILIATKAVLKVSVLTILWLKEFLIPYKHFKHVKETVITFALHKIHFKIHGLVSPFQAISLT